MARLWKAKYDEAKRAKEEADKRLKHAENMLTYWLVRLEEDEGKGLDA